MTDTATPTDSPTANVPNFAPPTDLPELQPFWDAALRGELAFPRCAACARWHWYPGPACPCGHDGEFEWRTVSGEGTIYSFTRVHRAFLPSGSSVPCTVVLVEFDDAPGVRLVTNLVGPGADAPTIGARVGLSPTVFDTHTLPTFAITQGRPARESRPR